MTRRVKIVATTVVCVAAFGIAGLATYSFTQKDQNEIQVGAPFKLTRHDGETVSSKNYRDSYMLIYFGFTHCPATCPMALITMTEVLNNLEQMYPQQAEKILPIFISVDPYRDTPEILKSYIAYFHPRFQGFTSAEDQLTELVSAYGGHFSYDRSEDTDNYNVNHSSYIYFMGFDGKYLAHFGPEETADSILEAIEKLIS